MLTARFLRTHSTYADGSPAEVLASFEGDPTELVAGAVVEVADLGYGVVEAKWPAGKVPDAYNYITHDALPGDTVVRLRPVADTVPDVRLPEGP